MNQSLLLPGDIHAAKELLAHFPVRHALPGMFALLLAVSCGGCITHRVEPSQAAAPAAETAPASPQQAPVPATPAANNPATPANGELNLHQAIDLAMKQNRALQAVLQERDIAQGRVTESYSAALPHITANGSYARLDEVSQFEIAGQQVSMGFKDNYSSDISVFQPLFHGGAILGTLKSASLSSLMSAEQIRGAIQGTIFQVAKAYYDVLLSQRMVEVTEAAAASAQAHLADVENMKRAGAAADYDVLRAKVEVSNLGSDLLRQKNSLNLARASLFSAVGLSQDSRVILATPLEFRPSLQPIFEEGARIAHENRPDVRLAGLGVKIQEEALRLACSKYWPQADAFFTYKWANPDPHSSTSDDWGDAWTAGATVSLPLFDGLGRRGKIAQEKARLKQSQLNREAAEEQALLEVKQAMLSEKDAEQLVLSQSMNLAQAQEGLRLAEVGYKSGVRTEVEVMDARTALTRTQMVHGQALYGHMMARLSLTHAMGTLESANEINKIENVPAAANGTGLTPDREQ